MFDPTEKVDGERALTWNLQRRDGHVCSFLLGSLNGGMDVIHQYIRSHNRHFRLAQRASNPDSPSAL